MYIVKVFMPLYSIQVWGKYYGPYPFGYMYPAHYSIKGYCIYQRRRTWHGIICIKEKYYTPYNPQTPKQQSNRQKISDGVSLWKNLTSDDKDYYNKLRYPRQMGGYHRFLHYYLTGKPC